MGQPCGSQVPDPKYLVDPGPCPLPLAATYTCSGLASRGPHRHSVIQTSPLSTISYAETVARYAKRRLNGATAPAARPHDVLRGGHRVISDCHFFSTARPLHTKFPIILTVPVFFSKVTIGYHPRSARPRSRCGASEQQIGGSGGSLEPPRASSYAPPYRLYGVF